jgi:hypothetical protein
LIRVFATAYLALLAAHWAWLDLPFHWDEAGQFVMQALDLYERGLWIPARVHPNSHPPALVAILAAWWKVAGYSIESTRALMLAFGAAMLTGTWMLAREMGCGRAWLAPVLLFVSPVFFMQSMMAQLDLPSAAAVVWAMLWFVQGRIERAALSATAAVLLKETSLTIPFVMACWTLPDRRTAWFGLPAAALAGWFGILKGATGHWFGDPEYGSYNLRYTLHPVRLPLSLARRFYTLLVDQGHWAVSLILWSGRTRLPRDRRWLELWTIALFHLVAVGVLGGATLERYLLPAYPVLMVTAAFVLEKGSWRRMVLAGVAIVAMAGSMFLYPVHPFSYENHVAMVDFVRLQQQVAADLERRVPGAAVAAAWPLSDGLRRPPLGYVELPFTVRKLGDTRRATLEAFNWREVDALVMVPLTWEGGAVNVVRFPWVRRILTDAYGYEPAVDPEEVGRITGFELAARFREGPLEAFLFLRGTDSGNAREP